MAKKTRPKRSASRAKRVSRTYRLPLAKLSAAKRALGTTTSTEAIEKALNLAVFQRRIIAPSADAWHRSGDVLAALAASEGLQLARVSKAFGNDILLAISCRESGCILITENERDFARIRRFVKFDYMKPWPGS